MLIFKLANFNDRQKYYYMLQFSNWVKNIFVNKLLYSMIHTYNFNYFNKKMLKNQDNLKFDKNKMILRNSLLNELNLISKEITIDKFLKVNKIPLILEIEDEFCKTIIYNKIIKHTSQNMSRLYQKIINLDKHLICSILIYIY